MALGGEIEMLEAWDTASNPSNAVAPTPSLRMMPQADGASPVVLGRNERSIGATCSSPASRMDMI